MDDALRLRVAARQRRIAGRCYGDLLIFSCDGSDEAFVVALDKRTGKVRWKTGRRQPFDQAYSTPLVIRVGDRDQVVSVGAYRAGGVRSGIGPGDLARQLRRRVLERAAAGVRPRPGLSSRPDSSEPSLLAVRADGTRRRDPDARRLDAWRARAADAVAAPRRRRNLLVNDVGIASCLDAKTGEIALAPAVERQLLRVARLCRRADLFPERGRRRDGHRAGHGVPRLATNTLDGATLASMAVVDDSLLVRTDTHLYRLGVR